MRTELPVCKRCCFCLPLRYGLLTWGYFNLITSSLVLIALFVTLYNMVELIIIYKNTYHLRQVITISIVMSIFLLDVILNAVFIVGGHKKNVKLLRVYYYYNIVLWVLTVLIALIVVVMLLPSVINPSPVSYHTWVLILDLCTSFINIILHTYLILLIRSEIVKLRNNCEFRFVNNAAEAECTLKFEAEGIADGEKEIDDINEKETEDVCKPSCEKTCPTKGTCCSRK